VLDGVRRADERGAIGPVRVGAAKDGDRVLLFIEDASDGEVVTSTVASADDDALAMPSGLLRSIGGSVEVAHLREGGRRVVVGLRGTPEALPTPPKGPLASFPVV
jgi:hypothetical protein